MEYVATLQDHISGPAGTATASMVALRDSILQASAALKAYGDSAPKAGKAKSEGSTPKAEKPHTDDAEKAAKSEAAAKAKAQKEQEAAAKKAQKEQDSAQAKAQKEQEKAAKRAEDARKNSYLGKASDDFRNQLKSAVALGAILKVAKDSVTALARGAKQVGAEFYQLALGPYGAAKLDMLTARMKFNFGKLFKGIDYKPFLTAVEKLGVDFTRQTATGRAMGDGFKRVGDTLFSAFAKVMPLIEAFGQGIVYGALLAENALLRVRLKLITMGINIDKLVGSEDMLNNAFLLGVGAFGAAAAVLGLVAGVVVGIVAGMGYLVNKVADVSKAFWKATDSVQDFLDLILKVQNLSVGGVVSDLIDKVTGSGKDTAAAASKSATESGKGTSPAAGEAIAGGLIEGMKRKEGEVSAAGAALAKAADQGVKDAAQIKSPSKLMQANAAYMAEGMVVGLDRSGPRVQAAADRALVPDVKTNVMTGSASAGGSAGGGTREYNFTFAFPGITSGDPDKLKASLSDPSFLATLKQIVDSEGGALEN